MQGVTWEKPNYPKEDKKVFIPTDQELWLAVNSGNKPSLAFSLLIYETGARIQIPGIYDVGINVHETCLRKGRDLACRGIKLFSIL